MRCEAGTQYTKYSCEQINKDLISTTHSTMADLRSKRKIE